MPLSEDQKQDRIAQEKLFGAKKELSSVLEQVISRSYKDGIDRILDIKVVSANQVKGLFKDGEKIIRFHWNKKSLSYKRVDSSKRGDSCYESLIPEDKATAVFLRNDARRKGKQCKKGISCGDACIERSKTCEVPVKAVASVAEQKKIEEISTIVAVSQEVERSPDQAHSSGSTPIEADELDTMTIRQLKTKARENSVRGYSEMSSQQLREAIRISNSDEEQQGRVLKTLNSYRNQPISARKYGLIAKESKAEAGLVSAIGKWNRIARIARVADREPKIALLAMSAFVAGMTTRQFVKAKDKYRDGFKESAAIAVERANKMPTVNTDKENITFAVSGFSPTRASSKEIIEAVTTRGNKGSASESDKWLTEEHEFIGFDLKEFQIAAPSSNPKNKDGSDNLAYQVEASMNSVGAFMENFRRGRNDDAVELAATLYAYANRRDPDSGLYLYADKRLNVIAHGTGGNVAYEAMEILSRMNQPRARNGKEVLDQINLVTMGTAHFGVTERVVKERNLTSPSDPTSVLPSRSPKWVSDVKGSSVWDYVGSDSAVEEIKRAFGYYSYNQYERQEKLRRKGVKNLGLSTPSALTPKPASKRGSNKGTSSTGATGTGSTNSTGGQNSKKNP